MRKVSIVIAVISMASSALFATNATSASPGLPSLPLQASEIAKERLLDIAAKFEAKFGSENLENDPTKLGSPSKSGFISVAVNPDTNRIELYWAGKPTADVLNTVLSEKSIELKQGLNSLEFMHDAGIRIIQDFSHDPDLRGLKFELFRPHLDGSGIDIEVSSKSQELSSEAASIIEVKFSQKYSIDVNLKTRLDGNGINFAASRQNDASAYSGGAGYETSAGNYCSTGFGVKKTSTNVEYLLTAYHCFMGNGTNQNSYKPGTSTAWGTWSQTSAQFMHNRDAALIKPNSSNASGYVYTGNFSSSTKELIYGTATNVVGMSACIDGANSGYRCGVIVSNTSVIISLAGVNVTVVEGSASGIPGVVHGDSGGRF